MGRPREHDEATRVALLAAAERIIRDEGPAALSARSLAEACDTTTRAVYSLFGSMPGLLEALATRLFELLGQAIDGCEPSSDPVADLVTASISGFRHVALEHAALYHLVFSRVVPDLELGSSFESVASATFARLEALVERVALAGALDPELVRPTAVTVHALTEGLASVELRGSLGTPDEALELWRHALTTLLCGVTASAPAPRTPTAPRRSPARRSR